MQIPLTKGMAASPLADLDASLPINMETVASDSGISKAYLRSAMGATTVAMGPGTDRGGFAFGGICYRVMGTKFVSIGSDYTVTTIGDVGPGGPCGFAEGFGRLAIQSGTNLYYWDGTTLAQVTNPNLGTCLDVAWLDDQYFTTDGTDILAADIDDPTSFTAIRYGSAESSPDAIVGLMALRGEMLVFGTDTIEVQSYVGGSNFPLQANPGGTIPKGCVGSRAKCVFSQSYAFVGGSKNEQPGVWLGGAGTAVKLSTRLVDDKIEAVVDKSLIEIESRTSRDEERLYVHLPNETLVHLFRATNKIGEPIWYVAKSGRGFDEPYRPRRAVYAYGQWIVGDTQTASIGVLTEGPATVANPVIFMSMSHDGETFGLERATSAGVPGERRKRVQWSPHRRARNYLVLRFRGETGLDHFGEAVGWQIQTACIYNGANSFILHNAELVGLPGRGVQGWAALEATVEGLKA